VHVVRSSYAVPRHRVPRALIEQVFAGPVDAAAIGVLLDGQYSRRLLLLKVLREWSPDVGRVAEEAWPILVEAEKRAPEVVREILLYPSVGTWLVHVVRKIRGIINDDVPIWVDMGYLGSIAVTAAIRARIEVTATALVWRGRLTLPTIGQFEVAGDDNTYLVRIRVTDSGVFLERTEDEWISLDEIPGFPLRKHRSTAGAHTICWTVDDIDPYRSFAAAPANDCLTAAEFDTWCGKLDRAWAILVEEHADYLPELSAAGPVIVPAPRVNGFVASSSAASFGAIRAAIPETPAAMAETLLHELQHSKLNALLDLVPLQQPGTDRLCYAPWRRDPRPLSGLLHGIYAFVGVTEYWYRRWRSHQDRLAAFHFLYHQEQVWAALRELGPTPELTETGASFISVATARLTACDGTAGPADVREVVTALIVENRLAWRLKHLVPPAEHVAALADRWFEGGPPSAGPAEPDLRPFHRPEAESALSSLFTARALDPDPEAAPDVRPGERELVGGDLARARVAFAGRIQADAGDDSAWVGLLMAMGVTPPPPETVSATYRRIAATSDAPPDPTALVEWLANG
jgi:HEXXH motif-containing protein